MGEADALAALLIAAFLTAVALLAKAGCVRAINFACASCAHRLVRRSFSGGGRQTFLSRGRRPSSA
jgi:hypothetical protein